MTTVVPLTDKQLHQLSISIGKAVNPTETPVKEKHVRSAIIGTYQEKSGCLFWLYMLRQPLQEHQIVAWKFCHVLHKILREGHPKVIPDSYRYRGILEDIGKLWQHLREGYGRLIQLYVRLIVTKLDFHKRNPRLPGNLQVTAEELEAIGENDINVYFQMSVEMFDYMDDILNLQSAVFNSLRSSCDPQKSSSMTPNGQCRLGPLIPCIQDASMLYDYCVKILFKLHEALPADTLAGHRDRFSKQFYELKTFYSTVKHMQYFKHLITIPSLPDKPSNFLVHSELRSYVTPIVVLPPEEPLDPEIAVDTLIDISDTSSIIGDQPDTARNGSDTSEAWSESTGFRENLVAQLHQENMRQRQELFRTSSEYQRTTEEFQTRIAQLETELVAKCTETQDTQKQKEELMTKQQESEEKCKVLEQKFQKLKDVYAKLREEHISLIRKKAEVDKHLGAFRMSQEQSDRRTADLERRATEAAQCRNDLDLIQKQFEAVKSENMVLMKTACSLKQETEVERAAFEKERESTRQSLAHLEPGFLEFCKEKGHQAAYSIGICESILSVLSEAEYMLTQSLLPNSPILTELSGAQNLERLCEPTRNSLADLEAEYRNYLKNRTNGKRLIAALIRAAYLLATALTYAKAGANSSKDITLGDKLAEECTELGARALAMLNSAKEFEEATIEDIHKVKQQFIRVFECAQGLSTLQHSVEAIGDLVEKELQSMDKAIEEAASRIQEMLEQSRKADSGLKLEVNKKILDSCTELMKFIRILVKKSRLLQAEIVEQGKGTASATEFYKRNHQWSEGLISAAKAIATGAVLLLEAADKVVTGNGKFEELVVASQGIAASTVQLVIASRVKASPNSSNLAALSDASKDVSRATGGVVATAKNCSQLVEENDELDLSEKSLLQSKRQEMEVQVHVLELEQALETERLRLAALRRYHYQLDNEAAE